MITERMVQRALSAEILLHEVTGVKVCIVYAAELGLHVHDGCGGFCCGYLSSTVKRLLPDRYRGDRATIVLNENCYNNHQRRVNSVVEAAACRSFPSIFPIKSSRC